MKITEVRVSKLKTDNRLKAIASINFEDCFVVHGVRIIEGEDGLFMAMPSRKLKDGTYLDTAHPISNEFRKQIEDTVLKAYTETINK